MHQSPFYLTLSYHCSCYVKCLCNPTQNKDVELTGKIAQRKALFYARSGQGSNHWCLGSTRDSMRKDHAAEGKHINPSFSNSSTLALFWQMCHPLRMTSTSSVSQDLTNSLPDGDVLWQGWATRVLREKCGYRGSDVGTKGQMRVPRDQCGPQEGTCTPLATCQMWKRGAGHSSGSGSPSLLRAGTLRWGNTEWLRTAPREPLITPLKHMVMPMPAFSKASLSYNCVRETGWSRKEFSATWSWK